ncbi:MAG TPA: tRNA pseudouridine(38-40) synthase TruA [Fimbriimonas sp.]|nr:tRNA pseudouridine(38-40) synthase TruA [Fimbriimonas sp.]
MRIKLVVSYDGTDFCGWAPQLGLRTVQGTLTEAVRRVSGEENEIVGASRTDSGAHSKGQTCHFDTESGVPSDRWARILNRQLPCDMTVVSSEEVKPDFHSRFSAVDRYYRYRILVGPNDPMRSRYVHLYGRPLNVPLMDEAGQRLQGDHDFLAFTEELDESVQNTRRTLFQVKVSQTRDEVWVDVVGTAFLRGMMRRIAGALLEVGRGHRPVEEVSRLLTSEGQSQLQWPVVLPAAGLCLMRVRYGRHPRDHRIASDDSG